MDLVTNNKWAAPLALVLGVCTFAMLARKRQMSWALQSDTDEDDDGDNRNNNSADSGKKSISKQQQQRSSKKKSAWEEFNDLVESSACASSTMANENVDPVETASKKSDGKKNKKNKSNVQINNHLSLNHPNNNLLTRDEVDSPTTPPVVTIKARNSLELMDPEEIAAKALSHPPQPQVIQLQKTNSKLGLKAHDSLENLAELIDEQHKKPAEPQPRVIQLQKTDSKLALKANDSLENLADAVEKSHHHHHDGEENGSPADKPVVLQLTKTGSNLGLKANDSLENLEEAVEKSHHHHDGDENGSLVDKPVVLQLTKTSSSLGLKANDSLDDLTVAAVTHAKRVPSFSTSSSHSPSTTTKVREGEDVIDLSLEGSSHGRSRHKSGSVHSRDGEEDDILFRGEVRRHRGNSNNSLPRASSMTKDAPAWASSSKNGEVPAVSDGEEEEDVRTIFTMEKQQKQAQQVKKKVGRVNPQAMLASPFAPSPEPLVIAVKPVVNHQRRSSTPSSFVSSSASVKSITRRESTEERRKGSNNDLRTSFVEHPEFISSSSASSSIQRHSSSRDAATSPDPLQSTNSSFRHARSYSPSISSQASSSNFSVERTRVASALKRLSQIYSAGWMDKELRSMVKSMILDENDQVVNLLLSENENDWIVDALAKFKKQ